MEDKIINFTIHYMDEQVLLWREPTGKVRVLVGLGCRQWEMSPVITTAGKLYADTCLCDEFAEALDPDTVLHVYSCYPNEGEPEGFTAIIQPGC
jgi:hypothetical protein